VRSCWPVLEIIGNDLFHVGPVGAGSAGKLVNNLLSLGTYLLQLEAMQLAKAYGIDEDSATSFLASSGGDSRGIRTWGRLDRIRRETRPDGGNPPMYALAAKDIRAAALAASSRSVLLPLAAVMGDLVGPKMAERDQAVSALGAPPTPRCNVCHQELAAPFRATGTHPECRSVSSEEAPLR
jgi:3-hydroxyisobutyrate dehydrogenase-like beta-hydroxyacid dehydrogenase